MDKFLSEICHPERREGSPALHAEILHSLRAFRMTSVCSNRSTPYAPTQPLRRAQRDAWSQVWNRPVYRQPLLRIYHHPKAPGRDSQYHIRSFSTVQFPGPRPGRCSVKLRSRRFRCFSLGETLHKHVTLSIAKGLPRYARRFFVLTGSPVPAALARAE